MINLEKKSSVKNSSTTPKFISICKLIAKGILLWFTIISITLFIMGGFESLIELGNTEGIMFAGYWLVCNAGLVYICYNKLTSNELYTLTLTKYINKLFKKF